MSEDIKILKTGVPGLDVLLGGGIPELSFNIIAGAPGCGKTTFAQQLMFALTGSGQRAIFFTALGEPPLKMLRYQTQFKFFDVDRIENSIRFINLGAEVLEGDFEKVLRRIVNEVRDFDPHYVFVDSFRSIINKSVGKNPEEAGVQQFIQHLAMQMTNWQATTFLIGEYDASEANWNPIFTIADGILWCSQNFDRNAMVRKLSIYKMRGLSQITGMHTFQISEAGIEVFPRGRVPTQPTSKEIESRATAALPRLSMGIAALDDKLGGGLPSGYTLLVVGPSGVGKTVLGSQFIAEGIGKGEHGLMVSFEKAPQLSNPNLCEGIRNGLLTLMDLHSVDLSVDEMLHAMLKVIDSTKVKRVLFDSVSGFEVALAPEFRDNLRDALYRLTSALNNRGVTVVMTAETEDRFTDIRFNPYGSAYLADGIVLLRYIETGGEMQRILTVLKLRGSAHSKKICFYDINDHGMAIGESPAHYDGLLTGQPRSDKA